VQSLKADRRYTEPYEQREENDVSWRYTAFL